MLKDGQLRTHSKNSFVMTQNPLIWQSQYVQTFDKMHSCAIYCVTAAQYIVIGQCYQVGVNTALRTPVQIMSEHCMEDSCTDYE